MTYVPDNYDMFLAHEQKEEDRIARLPVCEWCGEPIQDEQFYHLDGEYICKACMDDKLVYTSDFII